MQHKAILSGDFNRFFVNSVICNDGMLRLEPGIQDAYYWLIVASENMGNSMTAGSYDKMAQEQLSEEEYDRLQQVLALRAHPEGETT